MPPSPITPLSSYESASVSPISGSSSSGASTSGVASRGQTRKSAGYHPEHSGHRRGKRESATLEIGGVGLSPVTRLDSESPIFASAACSESRSRRSLRGGASRGALREATRD